MVGWRGLLARAVTALGILMSASAGSEPAFDRLVVFGDSLSDTGNAGRFSDGPVWVEMLADQLNLPLEPSQAGGLNFAVGGARLDPRSGSQSSLRAQVDRYLKMPRRAGRTLHVIYGGGNDVLAAVGQANAPAAVEAAAASLRSIVTDLVDRHTTDLLIPNLPNVGITPEIRGRGPHAVNEAQRLTFLFNNATDRVLREVAEARARSFRLYRLDVRAMAERVIEDPAAFGFVDVIRPCDGSPRCEGYLFWDHIHPTSQAHRRLAEAALGQVTSKEVR